MRKNKLNNKKTVIHGIQFASEKEAFRYLELYGQLQRGEIESLELQKEYELIPKLRKSNGKFEQPVRYTADFVYTKGGVEIVEDVKGMKTRDYIMRRKMMLFFFNIEIHET